MSNLIFGRDEWIVIPEVDQITDEEVTRKESNATGIAADTLIPGRGKPLRDHAVICKDGKIIYVGPHQDAIAKYPHIEMTDVPVIMPGMWECHSHFFGASPLKPINVESAAMGDNVEAGARNVRALKDTLYAGFTSCVDLGGYAPELQKVIDEGLILGPTLYGAGAALSMTGGHGEVFELPYGNVRQRLGVNAPGTQAGTVGILLADGPDEVRKAVRINIRRGARVIKVFTSGGSASRDDNPLYQQFSDEELRIIVEEAKRVNLICAAHAVGKPGIMAAIRAGFKVIEHNSYADDEVFKAIKKHNVMVVATITPLQSILEHKEDYPRSTYEKTKAVSEAHFASYRRAIREGVTCAMGSDLFGGVGSVLSPGMNGREVVYATKFGMSALEAIEAATANGPCTIGPQAPLSGQLRVGYDADMLGLERNPLDDIEIMSSPKDIKYIWKGGRLVKAPGLDPWDALGV